MSEIRLACSECDTDDGDGLTSVIAAVQEGWREVQYLDESPDDSVWWDHIGLCPRCVAEEHVSHELYGRPLRPFADFKRDADELRAELEKHRPGHGSTGHVSAEPEP